MAKNIKIIEVDCGQPIKCIGVDKHLVRAEKTETLKFKNELSSAAEIKFYDADDKDSTTPLSNFCDGIAGTTLPVPLPTSGANKTECELKANKGDYAYRIDAGSNYIPLDPIIIIEPQYAAKGVAGQSPVSGSHLPCAIIIVLTAALAFWFGTRTKRGSG